MAGKRISVLGAGRSGLAVARLLLNKGARVFLSDNRTTEFIRSGCEKLKKLGLEYELGSHSENIFAGKDLLVISPGIGIENQVVVEASKKGIPVTGELEVASWFCRNPIIAITGTNGKSTVTLMLDNIFKAAGKPAKSAGNIGTAFSNIVENMEAEETVILEVSSYQLETIGTFHPDIAVILNISPDHLGRHKTMAEYTKSKLRIGENQRNDDVMVLNQNDSIVRDSDIPGEAKKIWINNIGSVENGAGIKNNNIFLFLDDEEKEIMPAGDLTVPGSHNVENALAAAAAAGSTGISHEDIAKGLSNFKGLEHRLEFVDTVKGVKFINDSKATNISAMIAALGSFSGSVILIAGGEDKGSDLSVADSIVAERVKTLILLGEASGRMYDAWQEKVSVTIKVESFEDAVDTAYRNSKPGDTVLLAPGCASFDMFTSFEERGITFKAIVHSLKK